MSRPRTVSGDWLKEFLANGRKSVNDVKTEAARRGERFRTISTRKRELGIVSERIQDVWYWRDPSAKNNEF
jgi:hypothetical protein